MLNYGKIKSTMHFQCHGITKFPNNNNYAMVLDYAPEGNLRNYLKKNHPNLTLKDRILLLCHLCGSLDDIHFYNLVHCDLHSGNILVQGGTCSITDLGLCGPVDDDESS